MVKLNLSAFYRIFLASSNSLPLIGCYSYHPIIIHENTVTFKWASFWVKWENSPHFSLFFFFFFVFNVGLLQPTAFKVGKFGFFLFASETFVFLVELYSETFTRASQRFSQLFNYLNINFFLYIFSNENNIYSFIKGLLHFGRNWRSWKGPNFKVVEQINVF